jgi:hypothetical protein
MYARPSAHCASNIRSFCKEATRKNNFVLQVLPHHAYRKGVAGGKAYRCRFIAVGIKATSSQGRRTSRGGGHRDLLHYLRFRKQPWPTTRI